MNNPSKFLENLLYDNPLSEVLVINKYPLLVVLWNLLLLLVPFLACFYLIRYYTKNKFKKISEKIIASVITFLWLLFIPNSAYIITDVRHLLDYCPRGLFYRACPEGAWLIMFFFIYASVGWVVYVYLLNQMKAFIKVLWGKKISRVFIYLIIPLISTGVLLGLVNRWNSWDLFIHPLLILNSMLRYITDIVYFKNWIIFTAGLYLLYFVGNWLFGGKNKFFK